MNGPETVNAVIRMQDYIHQNIDENITLDALCSVSGYSKRHSLRIFKELLHKTPYEYIRDFKMTLAAKRLINPGSSERVLDIALDSGFTSHEGFTKAFHHYFGVPPQKFGKRAFPENYTKPTPMSYYYLLLRSKGINAMIERTVTATYLTKSACKLIIKRGILSTDYFSYCDEIGCDIWDELEKVPNRLDEVVFVTLPDSLVIKGSSNVGAAVEVGTDWQGKLPDGCDIIALPEQTVVWFQGMPYDDENWYGGAHAELDHAMNHYNPALFGYQFAFDVYPQFQYSASAKKGVKAVKPVARL